MRTQYVFVAGMMLTGIVGCGPDPRVLEIVKALEAAKDNAPAMEIAVTEYGPLESLDVPPPAESGGTILLLHVKQGAFRLNYKAMKDGRIKFEEIMSTPDGETCFYSFPGSNEFNIRSGDQWEIMFNIPVPFYTPVHTRPLYKCLRDDEMRVLDDTAQVDGAICRVVEGKETRVRPPTQYKLYLDPAIGMMPRQIESLEGNRSRSTVRFKEYTEIVAGSWFPRRVEVEHIPPPPQTKKRMGLYLAKYRLQPDMPDSDFVLSPPPGARVTDERR